MDHTDTVDQLRKAAELGRAWADNDRKLDEATLNFALTRWRLLREAAEAGVALAEDRGLSASYVTTLNRLDVPLIEHGMSLLAETDHLDVVLPEPGTMSRLLKIARVARVAEATKDEDVGAAVEAALALKSPKPKKKPMPPADEQSTTTPPANDVIARVRACEVRRRADGKVFLTIDEAAYDELADAAGIPNEARQPDRQMFERGDFADLDEDVAHLNKVFARFYSPAESERSAAATIMYDTMVRQNIHVADVKLVRADHAPLESITQQKLEASRAELRKLSKVLQRRVMQVDFASEHLPPALVAEMDGFR